MKTKLREEGGNVLNADTVPPATKCMMALVTHHFGNSCSEERSLEMESGFKVGDKVKSVGDYIKGRVGVVTGFGGMGWPDDVNVQFDGQKVVVRADALQLAEPAAGGGLKYDSNKPPMDLISRTFLVDLAKVLGFGATKYKRNNWREGIEQSRLIAAALRHITAYNEGEDTDPESGLSHIAHAACCLMFLSELSQTRPDLDDRWKRNNV